MVIAWIGFASIGTMLARHYKPVWGDKKIAGTHVWFTFHRAIMATSLLCVIVAMACIFTYVGGWAGNFPHPILGVTTNALMLVQIIGAQFRCGPQDDKRWIFNWVHFLLGNTTHILAIVTTILAANIEATGLKASFLAVVVAYVIAHVLIHLIIQIYTWMQTPKNSDDVAMRDMSVEEKAEAETPLKKFKLVMLGIYGLVVAVLTFVLVLLIVG
jgi:hypothetical protein